MFPLGSVLLPGEALPLHVFEPRYRRLVQDLLAADGAPEFGVTLIERGSEVGGGDQRSSVGTMARVVDVRALDEGRYRVVAVGVRRIVVGAWLEDDPYPRADVDDWPDPAPATDIDATIAFVRERIRAIHAVAAELGDPVPPTDVSLGDDPILATYHLATLSPLGAADRYRLLAAESPEQRLALLGAALDDVDAMLAFRRTC